MKLGIVGILSTAWQTMRMHWRDYAVIAALPVAISLAFGLSYASLVGEVTKPEDVERVLGAQLWMMPLAFIVLLLYASICISIVRIMNGLEARPVFFRTDFKRQLWVVWTLIKMMLYMAWPIFVAQIVMGIIIGAIGNMALFVVGPAMIGVVVWRLIVFVRISIALPANCCDENLKLAEAYQRTQGTTWPIFVLLFLAPFAIGAAIALVQLPFIWSDLQSLKPPSFWPSLPFSLLGWVLTMFYYTLLAEVYRVMRAGGVSDGQMPSPGHAQ
jgi:hypothetical protein